MRFLLPLVLVGCADPMANCEVVVNDVTICLEGQMSLSFCEGEIGGTGTIAESSDDPTCADLGYPTACSGEITQGDGTVTYLAWAAATSEDCVSTTGGTIP